MWPTACDCAPLAHSCNRASGERGRDGWSCNLREPMPYKLSSRRAVDAHSWDSSMIIHVEATAAVYLAFALPGSACVWLVSRRPITSAVIGSACAMVATSALKHVLPFNYWAHANDLIIGPFFQLKLLTHPIEAALSLLFHVGLPVVFMWFVNRTFTRTPPLNCCQQCGYGLTGNVSGICPECGTEIRPRSNNADDPH